MVSLAARFAPLMEISWAKAKDDGEETVEGLMGTLRDSYIDHCDAHAFSDASSVSSAHGSDTPAAPSSRGRKRKMVELTLKGNTAPADGEGDDTACICGLHTPPKELPLGADVEEVPIAGECLDQLH